MNRKDSALDVELHFGNASAINVEVSLAQLEELARAVVVLNRKRTFDGIEFFE